MVYLPDKKDQEWTALHEFIHVEDRHKYLKSGGSVGDDYYTRLRKTQKRILDKLGITKDNVGDISDYAEKQFKISFFDEVYTEYRTKKRLKK